MNMDQDNYYYDSSSDDSSVINHLRNAGDLPSDDNADAERTRILNSHEYDGDVGYRWQDIFSFHGSVGNSDDDDFGNYDSGSDHSFRNKTSTWNDFGVNDGAGPSQPKANTSQNWHGRCRNSSESDSAGAEIEYAFKTVNPNPPMIYGAGEVPMNMEAKTSDPDHLLFLNSESGRKIDESFVRFGNRGNKTTNTDLIKGYKKRILQAKKDAESKSSVAGFTV